MINLKRIKELSEKAAPGPWYWSIGGYIRTTPDNAFSPAPGVVVIEPDRTSEVCCMSDFNSDQQMRWMHGNSAYIQEMRTAGPEMAEWIERALPYIKFLFRASQVEVGLLEDEESERKMKKLEQLLSEIEQEER